MDIAPQIYCVASIGDLEERLARQDWHEVLRALFTAVYRDAETEREEINISQGSPILWYLSALRRLEMSHCVQFDSQQYSIFAKVSDADSVPSHISSCRSAFYLDLACREVDLEWEVRSWSPIASGFLLGI